MLGNLLGLRNVILLEPTATEMPGSGFGIVGEPEHVLPTEEFLRTVRDRLSLKCIRYSGITRPTVRRAALLHRSRSLHDVRRQTGGEPTSTPSADFKYNDFLDADRELVIADIGHFESEYCAIDLIYEIIRKKCLLLHFIRACGRSIRELFDIKHITTKHMATSRRTADTRLFDAGEDNGALRPPENRLKIDEINKIKGCSRPRYRTSKTKWQDSRRA